MFFAYRFLFDQADKRFVQGNNQERPVLTGGRFAVRCSNSCHRIVWLIIAMLIAPSNLRAGEGSIKHVGHGISDDIAQCITANTGLNVLVYEGFLRRFSEVKCGRGESAASTVNEIQQHGFRVLTNDHWALLVPDEMLTGVGWPFKVSWNNLKVKVYIEQASTSPPLPLPADVVRVLEEKLVKYARFIPVQTTQDSLDSQTAQINLRYAIYAFRNGTHGISVVGLLHQDDDVDSTARLILMNLIGNNVELLWDSPLFVVNAHAAEVDIQDVDGDGRNEIIVRATLERGAHGVGWDTITIFNDRGEEMTRQPECKWMRGDFEAGPDRVCPIAGQGGVDLHKTASGVLIETVQAPAKGGDAVYQLQGSHFVLVRDQRKRLYLPAPR